MLRVRSLLITIAMIACLLGSYVLGLAGCAERHRATYRTLERRCAVLEELAEARNPWRCRKSFQVMVLARQMEFHDQMQERCREALLKPWLLLCARRNGRLVFGVRAFTDMTNEDAQPGPVTSEVPLIETFVVEE